MSTLKSYRDNELKWFILAYLFLVIGSSNLDIVKSTDMEALSKIESLVSTALISGAICSLAFVIDSLYSQLMKDTLLYLGITKMPGTTVFTRIKNGTLNDIRFGIIHAQEKYKDIIDNIPSNKSKARYENSNWYKIYVKHKEDSAVSSVHRDFLLCRDLYITTISLAVLTGIAMVVKLVSFSWILLGYLIATAIITSCSAHNKAHRFVNTVIAVDVAAMANDEK
ncbi:MAG: hypothetical protein ACOYVD_10070 [Bacillota bacterium]